MANGNPFYVAPLGGDVSGITRGIAGLGALSQQRRDEEKKLARQQEAQAVAEQAFASGDPEQVSQAVLKYPEIKDRLDAALGFRSEATKKNFVDSAREILTNPEDAEQILERRVNMVLAEGGDPVDSLEALAEYRENPQAFLKSTELLYHSMASEQESKALQDAKKLRADLAAGKEKINLEKEKLAIRREENETRKLEQALKREDNKLKREELQLKIDEKKKKILKAQQDIDAAEEKKAASVDMAREAAQVARDILESPNLRNITGTIAPQTFTIRGESQDLINKANRLQSLLTVDNLKLMTGVLTDRDISFLTNVASGLNVVEGGIKGSEEGVRRRLQEIIDKLESRGGFTTAAGGGDMDSPQYQEGQTATNSQTGERMIFRGGRWQMM